MALEKEGYTAAVQGTTKVNVAVDSEGYISPSGAQAAGNKKLSINRVSADNSLTDNTEVLAFFLDLANGIQDERTNTMTVNWGV